MIARFAFVVALAVPTLASAAPLEREAVEKLIDRALADWQVPGAAVVIVDGEKTLYVGGRGVREYGKPELVTADTLFPLASCGKAFTTSLFAIAVDQKKLDWDDRVSRHLPTFHLSDPLADADVRLRDLLSHRTGVAPHDLLWYRSPLTQDELIERVGKLPLSRPFRTAMQYQSIMYMAAGKALEKATGATWEEQVRERLLRPLEMDATVLTTTQARRKLNLAAGHIALDGELKTIPWHDMPEPNAAGSVASTARDLAPWLRLHLNGGLHGERRLVSEESLRETHQPQTVIRMDASTARAHPFTRQMSYGLAWVIQDYRGEKLVSHGGVIDGFRLHVALVPERKWAVAALANRDQTRMSLALSNTLIDHLLEAEKKDWNAHYLELVRADEFSARIQAKLNERNRKRNTRPSLPIDELSGVYEEPAYGKAEVAIKNGELTLRWSSFTTKLQHWEFDAFKADNEEIGRELVEFQVAEGRCVGMNLLGARFSRK
jgi:CubicO group peptidase (beta-lactamase class C family)